MWKESQLKEQDKLVDEELDSLTNEVFELKLSQRAEIGTLKLELKAIQLFLKEVYPGFEERFESLRERVRLEINPE